MGNDAGRDIRHNIIKIIIINKQNKQIIPTTRQDWKLVSSPTKPRCVSSRAFEIDSTRGVETGQLLMKDFSGK